MKRKVKVLPKCGTEHCIARYVWLLAKPVRKVSKRKGRTAT